MKTVVSRFLPYVRLFSPFGIPLRVHYSSWIFNTGMAWHLQKPDVLFPGDFGMSLLFMACFMVCGYFSLLVAAFISNHYRWGVCEIRMSLMTGVIHWENSPDKSNSSVFWRIAAGGILTYFVLAGLLFAGHCLTLGMSDEAWERGFFFYLMIWNLVLGFFSLLPVSHSATGGWFLYGLLALKLSKRRALQAVVIIGIIISLGCMAWPVFRPFYGYEILLFVCGLFWLLLNLSMLRPEKAQAFTGE